MKRKHLSAFAAVACLSLIPLVAVNAEGRGTEKDDASLELCTPKPELDQATNKLSEIAHRYPEDASGVSVSDDCKTSEIFLKNFGGKAEGEVKKLSKEYPGLVVIKKVKYSLNDFQEALDKIDDKTAKTLGITGAGGDIVNDRLKITLENTPPDPYSKSASGVSKDEKKALTKLKDLGLDLAFQVEPGSDTAVADRLHDYSAFYMGSKTVNKATGAECSLGVPVKLNGKQMVLTAGHCSNKGGFHTPTGIKIGTTYTTSYPGNAYKYGDWQLVQGSTYSMNAYTGDLKSSKSAKISYGTTVPRARGQELCVSGSRTGSTCRYRVEANYQQRWVDGIKTGQLTTMYHRTDRKNIDCKGFKEGDSGGLVYSGGGMQKGSLIAYGIATAYNKKSCLYSFTQLSGVKAWNKNVEFDGNH